MKHIYKMLLFLAAVLLTSAFVSCEKENLGDENTPNGGIGFGAGNKIEEHEYVDLGLPSGLKWATCNVGANSPEEYGDYFAWGEIATKSEYGEYNSLTYKKSIPDISGNDQYDAARANWGGTSRIPTYAEIEELKNECTWEWTSQGGHNGYEVTGKNGNSIFLPATGYRYGLMLYFDGVSGFYWSSTPHESNTNSYILLFESRFYILEHYSRYNGRTVRPVSD